MIIAIAGFKGGIGKTTSAIHLANFLSDKGKTVLVDGDPNRSSTNWVNRGEFDFSCCDLIAAPKYTRDSDYTVLDTQARPDQDELSAIADGCDLLILPTSPDALAIEALFNTAEYLKNLDNCRVLLTLCDVRKKTQINDARKGIEKNQLPLFNVQIRLYSAYQKAALHGCSVDRVGDKFSKIAWTDYKKLGEEVLNYES